MTVTVTLCSRWVKTTRKKQPSLSRGKAPLTNRGNVLGVKDLVPTSSMLSWLPSSMEVVIEIDAYRCTRCRLVVYCNADCQSKAWPIHKIAACQPPSALTQSNPAVYNRVGHLKRWHGSPAHVKLITRAVASALDLRDHPNNTEKDCVSIHFVRRKGPAGRDDAPPEYAYDVKGGFTVSHEETQTVILKGQPKIWTAYEATVARMKRKGPGAPGVAMCLIMFENMTDAVNLIMPTAAQIRAEDPYWGPQFWLDRLSMALLAEAPSLELEELEKVNTFNALVAIRVTQSFADGSLKSEGKDPRLSPIAHVFERVHGVTLEYKNHYVCQNCGKSQESQLSRLLM